MKKPHSTHLSGGGARVREGGARKEKGEVVAYFNKRHTSKHDVRNKVTRSLSSSRLVLAGIGAQINGAPGTWVANTKET